ncbi:MAG: TIGR02452 family protein, partial [Myxococcales bacterium]|nr:TIGR02452 family protein [Myxococcales bacterium]
MSLKHLARATLALIEAGSYERDGALVPFAAAQRAAVAGARLYTPEALATLRSAPVPDGEPGALRVTDELTAAAARRLTSAGREVAALNFASARNPGGGFLNGARAQEEELCRCSGLYPTLLTQRAYYEANRAESSLIYTDHAIYSPGVPFFRVRARDSLLPAPFLVHVITAPAPNAGPLLQRDPAAGPAIAEAFTRRWANVLAIARANG